MYILLECMYYYLICKKYEPGRLQSTRALLILYVNLNAILWKVTRLTENCQSSAEVDNVIQFVVVFQWCLYKHFYRTKHSIYYSKLISLLIQFLLYFYIAHSVCFIVCFCMVHIRYFLQCVPIWCTLKLQLIIK